MRPRELILPVVTSVAIFAMTIFISCASTDRVQNDSAAETQETSVSDPNNPGDPNALPPDATQPPGDQAALGDQPAPPTDPNQPPQDANAQPPPPDANQPPAAPTDQPQAADAQVAANGPEAQPPTDASAQNPPAPPADVNPPPSQDAAAQTAPTDQASPGSKPVETNSDELLANEAKVSATEIAPATHVSKGSGYSLPKIPARALKKYKTSLNRFYFARKGDTAQSIASMVYGDSSRAKDIAKWNGHAKKFAAGRIVYYASASDPDDDQMKSFFQEHGTSPEEYVVRKGDWLSRIAAKRLGAIRSYKEIAVLNGITAPNAIEPGQKLALYNPIGSNETSNAAALSDAGGQTPAVAQESAKPSRKGRKHQANKDMEMANRTAEKPPVPVAPPVEQKPPVAEVPPPVQPAEDQPPVMQPENPPTAFAPPTNATSPEPMTAPEGFRKKSRKAGSSLDISRLIEQNLFFIFIGGGVSVLLLMLLAVKKRRAAQAVADEFGEDDFARASKRR